ncbi:Wzz/FepE/Etk N-terminal domain-containing protein [Francisellaceae bacterium]|nr:Wzz/FepE/Etk N-terminal domain-containing protein [Francisellaceae bacterium]
MDSLNIAKQLRTLILQWHWIIFSAIVSVIIGILVYLHSSSIYQSKSLVSVSPYYGNSFMVSILSSENNATLAQTLSSASKISVTNEQISLIESNSVIEKVVEKLHLDIQVVYDYFPVIGKHKAQGYNAKIAQHENLSKPFLGMTSYAWGGEIINISKLNIPIAWYGLPISFTYLGNENYRLKLPNGKSFAGKVGEVLKQDDIEVDVNEIRANEGLEFKIIKLSVESVVSDIQKSLLVQEANKDTTLVELIYSAGSPYEASNILSEIISQAIQMNEKLNNNETESTVNFLQTQLEIISYKLQQKTSQLTDYMTDKSAGGIDSRYESYLNRQSKLESQLLDLQNRYFKLNETYTEKDVKVITIKNDIAKTVESIELINQQIKLLPEKTGKIDDIKNEITVLKITYENVLTAYNQFSALLKDNVSSLSVLDRSTINPKSVNKSLKIILLLFLFLGVMAGCAIILLMENVVRGIAQKAELHLPYQIKVFELFNEISAWKNFKRIFQKKRRIMPNFLISKVDIYQYYNLKNDKALDCIGFYTPSRTFSNQSKLLLNELSKILCNVLKKDIYIIINQDLFYGDYQHLSYSSQSNHNVYAIEQNLRWSIPEDDLPPKSAVTIYIFGNVSSSLVNQSFIKEAKRNILLIERYKHYSHDIEKYMLFLKSEIKVSIDHLLLF